MNIKEIIQRLRTAMDDARGEESHFQSWLIQNEGICDAIDALKELDNSQRTWVGLTDEERKDIELGIEVFGTSVEDILK
jgi:hypothetical protein